jgi:hypothetical protein
MVVATMFCVVSRIGDAPLTVTVSLVAPTVSLTRRSVMREDSTSTFL